MLNIVPDKMSCISIASKDITATATADGGHKRQAFEATAKHDYELLNERVQHSKRYSLLKPDVVPQFYETNPMDYGYVRKAAIQHLDAKINMKLNILHLIYEGEESKREPDDNLSHRVFSWSKKDFLSRRKLHDFIWIDVMLRLTYNSLRTYKFKKDIEQLKVYLRYIFNELYASMEFKQVKIQENVIEPICNAKKVLQISKTIGKEFEKHRDLYWQILQKDTFIANLKRESLDMMMRLFMEAKKNNSYVWNPVELRYQLGWFASKLGQMKCRLEATARMRQNKIENVVKKNYTEINVNASIMDFYYSYIEDIKNRLNSLQIKLETEYEEYEIRLMLKRSKVEKLRDKWKFHKEEIERFHEELDIIKRRQEREAEQLAAQKLAEEQELFLRTKRRSTKTKQGQLAKNTKSKGPAKKNEPPKKIKAAGKPKKK